MRSTLTSKDHQDTRSFLMANVEVILENISARRKNRENQSEDIFAETVSNQNIHWLTNYQQRTRLQILKEEKNSLGLYMTGNPLEDYIQCLQYFVNLTGQKVLQIAIIDKCKKIFTKSGNMMFALQLTLIDQSIEGVIFAKKAADLSSILEEGELYWVLGKVSQRQPSKKEEVSEELAANDEIQETVAEESMTSSTSDSETEAGEGETETEAAPLPVLEVAEYVEKPKFLINSMVKFQDGLKALFSKSEVRSKDRIVGILPELDWAVMKENPGSFPQFQVPIKSKKSRSRNYSNVEQDEIPTPDYKNYEANVYYEERGNTSVNFEGQQEEIDNQTNDSKSSENSLNLSLKSNQSNIQLPLALPIVKITRSLGAKAAKIKSSLKKEFSSGLIEVEVWIENADGKLNKAKGTFWIEEVMLQSLI